jgi:MFS family permease
MATIYVHPGFNRSLHKPSKEITGLITSIYYLGTWLSYLFVAHPLADRFGRRVAAAAGVVITAVGASIQCSAKVHGGIAQMIVGRIVCGSGLAIVSTSVPLYQRSVPIQLSTECDICAVKSLLLSIVVDMLSSTMSA